MPSNRESGQRLSTGDFAFEVGQSFRHGTTFLKISDIGVTRYRLTNLRSLDVRLIEPAALAHEYRRGLLVPCAESDAFQDLGQAALLADDKTAAREPLVSTLSSSARAHGDKMRRYIQALRERGHTCLRPTPLLQLEYARLQKKFEDHAAPSLSTLYACSLKVARAGGDWTAAYPNFAARGGRGKYRSRNVAVERELTALIQEIRNDPSKSPRPSDVRLTLLSRLSANRKGDELLMPSLSTIGRRIGAELEAQYRYRRMHGPTAAAKAYRNWHPQDRAREALEVVEFDDKDCRVYAIDHRSGLPIGRIWLTHGVDQATDCLLGSSIGDEPRSVISAISAVADVVLPKDQTRLEWAGVKAPVPFGRFSIAVFDNAMYNHARDMEAVTLDVSNGVVSFAKPHTPTEKSRVEALNGRLASDFLPLLGVPHYKRQRGRDEPEPVNMLLVEFKARYLEWVYNVDANRPGPLGSTPLQRWIAAMGTRRPRVPSDIHRVRLATMLERVVKLRPEGLVFHGLVYQSTRLQMLRRQIGYNASITFRFHPNELAGVYVKDPKLNVWFEVGTAYPELTNNLTLKQHQLIRKLARDCGKSNPGLREMLASKEKLKKLVSDARYSNKRRERAWASRMSTDGPSPPPQPAAPTIVVMSDLEAQVGAIEDVVMEVGDDDWLIPGEP